MGFGLAAAIGGAGLLGGNYFGNKAASAGRGAANDAYDSLAASKGEALGRLDPYSNYGRQAMIPLSALLYGKNYDPATGKFTGDVAAEDRFNSFQESPGYQFRLNEGLKSIERRNAATGILLGGNTQKELMDYGQNTASDEYGNYLNSLMSQLQVGQNADTNAANVITGLGSQMAGYQYAGGMANAQKYSNLSNALFGMAGMGMQGAMAGGGGGPGGSSGGGFSGGSNNFSSVGGGQYNNSYFGNSGSSNMSPYTTLR